MAKNNDGCYHISGGYILFLWYGLSIEPFFFIFNNIDRFYQAETSACV